MSSAPPIRAVIVDDEAPARLRLKHLLRTEPDLRLVGECAGGREAIDTIRRDRPDLVFLDIQMPRIDGFAVCREIGPHAMPPVIFVTAYDQFALRAFEIHAVDYLLKPVGRERFRAALDQVRDRFHQAPGEAGDKRLLALLAALHPSAREPEHLALKVDDRVIFLRPNEISWVESDGNYVQVHAGTRRHLLRQTLSSFETQLPAGQFLRISRSVIVNLNAVQELQPMFYGEYAVILRDATRLTLSRSHRGCVQRLLARHK